MNGRMLFNTGKMKISAGTGNHMVLWDGLTKNKEQIKPGVYFVRCRSGNSTEARKLFVVK
jgi:hypothetical protein